MRLLISWLAIFSLQANEKLLLQEHFKNFYQGMVSCQLIPDASFEEDGTTWSALSGINVPFYNVVSGVPLTDWQSSIEGRIRYFESFEMPFVWCVDEEGTGEFRGQLLCQGFIDVGVFQGVIGLISQPVGAPEISEEFVLERVEDEQEMEGFIMFLDKIFGMEGPVDLIKKQMWSEANEKMFHWMAKREGCIVAALSTFIDGSVVSFRNGAALPEMRRQGLVTALSKLALQDAVSRGCTVAVSYLRPDAMALGICKQLGAESRWRYHMFIYKRTQ